MGVLVAIIDQVGDWVLGWKGLAFQFKCLTLVIIIIIIVVVGIVSIVISVVIVVVSVGLLIDIAKLIQEIRWSKITVAVVT